MTKGILLLSLLLITQTSKAENLTFQFDSPAFNGSGYSNHVLAIEQLQHTRKQALIDKKEAAERERKREEENTIINKFINNVQSRIYAQISKQMVDNMFTNTGDTSGTAELDGATIYWVKDVTTGTITIQITEEDGTFTELVVPIEGFGF